MYVAVNYGVANSIMLVGSGGNVIVDTTESIHSAEQIAAEFKAISDVETKAIIYTHHHSDHVIGTRVRHQSLQMLILVKIFESEHNTGTCLFFNMVQLLQLYDEQYRVI